MKRFRQILSLCIALSLPSTGLTAVAQRAHCDRMAVATPVSAAAEHHAQPDEMHEHGNPTAGQAMDCSALHCLIAGTGAAMPPTATAETDRSAAALGSGELPRQPTDPAPQDDLRPPIHG